MDDRHNKAEGYRARARDARERAARASNAVVRNTLLQDAEMFERMAQFEEKRKQRDSPSS